MAAAHIVWDICAMWIQKVRIRKLRSWDWGSLQWAAVPNFELAHHAQRWFPKGFNWPKSWRWPHLVQVLDLTGCSSPQAASSALSPVQISTACVAHDVVAVGGFNGELVVKSLAVERPVHRLASSSLAHTLCQCWSFPGNAPPGQWMAKHMDLAPLFPRLLCQCHHGCMCLNVGRQYGAEHPFEPIKPHPTLPSPYSTILYITQHLPRTKHS